MRLRRAIDKEEHHACTRSEGMRLSNWEFPSGCWFWFWDDCANLVLEYLCIQYDRTDLYIILAIDDTAAVLCLFLLEA